MSLAIRQSSKFWRDIKRLRRQGSDLSQLEFIVKQLVAQISLAEKYRDHALIGNWQGFRECHVRPDWLLIYRVESQELQLARTGSHSQLFG